jgi:phosphotransferase system HPr (HPr) family protein
MPEIHLLIIDPTGLHARPAAKFVQLASRFASRIVIRQADREVDAKSLTGVLGLTLRPSTVIAVRAEGSDALAALAALSEQLTLYVAPHAPDSALGADGKPPA